MGESGAILRLGEEVVGMIAAGEVVENPASAVKEMIENSLDAGAGMITVEIRDGGVGYIRVTDNGSGIARRDIRMAFERHATSKIRRAEDLFDLRTLGFRGEALASIAAVAKVTLTTRREGEDAGVRAVNEGGVFREIADAASPQGTTVVVRELFYNTPVRLKFLRKPATEGAKVAETVARFILARPDVAFRMISNGRQVYASSGSGDLRSAVFSVWGREAAENAVEVRSEGAVSVRGYVMAGGEARTTRARQTFIVNGRCIRSPLLSSALEDGCRERVTVGHYPGCVLLLDMPGGLVDVNVHPNKLEVRFSDDRLLFGKVRDAVRSGFSPEPVENAPRMTLAEPRETAAPRARLSAIPTDTEEGRARARSAVAEALAPRQERQESLPETLLRPIAPEGPRMPARALRETGPAPETPGYPGPAGIFSEAAASPREPAAVSAPEAPQPREAPAGERKAPALREEYRGYTVAGVLFDTYILLQNENQVVLVDQHAAHERILYERLMREIDGGAGSQTLLTPQIVHVTPRDLANIGQYAEEIREAGYEIEPFGEDALQLRAVPCVLGEPQGRSAFLDLVESLSELRVLSTRQRRRDAILQMACKKAVKGGDKISAEEIAALLNDIMGRDTPPTCPHGRPLMVVLTRQEIEKRFRRINS